MEERILQIMKTLDLTREEALELLADDNKIDHDEKMPFDLTKEQEKNAKKMRSTGQRAVDAYGKVRTRQRKEDFDKRFLIEVIRKALSDSKCEVEVTNIEREIILQCNDRKFKIVLSAPRS